MTTMELKSLKMDLVEQLLSINDKDTLTRVKNYLKKLDYKTNKVADTISKEEVLAGIEEGLKEVKNWKKTGEKRQTLREFINEL
ncbi:hypothetical protein [uncultured Parabacteroides sp.]|uniref:hypothetical protein n=1 Tax=uncultured Parabacteroides sp. TaxID=512312 RepID=UPI00259563F2|nr:hypothetical protein [uncultured Parabacteroides sp.]